IRRDVADDFAQRAAGRHDAFAPDVIGVGDLRITKPDSRRAAALDAKMNAGHPRIRDNEAVGCKLAAKIDVFRPAIERQVFVEAKAMRANWREAQSHVAAIGTITADQARNAFWRLEGSQDRPRRGEFKSWSLDASA